MPDGWRASGNRARPLSGTKHGNSPSHAHQLPPSKTRLPANHPGINLLRFGISIFRRGFWSPQNRPWPKNVHVYTGSDGSYGWDALYLDALIREMSNPTLTDALRIFMNLRPRHLPSLKEAHDRVARKGLPVQIVGEQRARENNIPVGRYPQIPMQSPNTSREGWIPGRPGQALIIVGRSENRKRQEAEFKRAAEEMKFVLGKYYGASVQVLVFPNRWDISEAIAQLGERGKDRSGQQALICYVGHGFYEYRFSGQDWTEEAEGMLALTHSYSGGNRDYTETRMKEDVGRHVAPNFDYVNIVINACHAGTFIK